MNIWATIITALIGASAGAGVTAVIARARLGKIKYKAIQDGLQSLLRTEIIRQNEKYVERCYCPIYAKDALRRVYEAYHALGGNGVMTDLYNDVMQLPETLPKQKQNNTEVSNDELANHSN